MKNRILPRLFLVLVCLALLCPVCAHAITALDPDAKASLTLCYQKDGSAFSGLPVAVYRVAEALPDGSFALLEPFSSYPINIHDISTQERWGVETQSIWSCIVAKQVQPDREGSTDGSGKVCFAELKTGLYFVKEAVAENAAGTYLFNRFMVYLPTPEINGEYNYDVEAKPKCTEFVPNSRYTVTKLWQDAGREGDRPGEVTVDIYKDGTLVDSQVLHRQNNWSYSWYVPEGDRANWTVAERTVPDGYRVAVLQNGSRFSIVNSRAEQAETPPQTGDSFSPLPWIIALCLSGILLVALGILSRRRK